MLVTADWLNRSLTLLDYARVTSPACSVEQAISGTIDLQAYPPGPLELALSADGKRALVSVGQGSFALLGLSGGEPVAPGGTLVFVDLEGKKALFEIATPALAEGVALTPDGKYGFSANYGTDAKPGDTVSKIDLASGKAVAQVKVGASPKQVAVSADGAIVMVSIAGDNGVRLFRADDSSASLGALVKTGSDPSGVVLIGAPAKSALVANATSLSYTVLDVNGTSAAVRATQNLKRVPYGVALIPGSAKVIVSAFLGTAELDVIDTAPSPPLAAAPIPLDSAAFPISVATDSAGKFAFVAHARDHALSVVDLASGEVRTLHWLAHAGPTYVALGP